MLECPANPSGRLWSTPLIGHGWALDHLIRLHRQGSLRQSYLVVGPAHVGKCTLALAFAQAIYCESPDGERACGQCRVCSRIVHGNHPDVSVIEPAGAAFTIDQVRELSAELPLSPLELDRKVRVLAGFELATREAQNALLKTLEEPPAHAVLFLTAPEVADVAPTISSRCQILRLRPVPAAELATGLRVQGVPDGEAEALALASRGRPGWALAALADPSLLEERQKSLGNLTTMLGQRRSARLRLSEALAAQERAKLVEMLNLWQMWWHDMLLLAIGAKDGYVLPRGERPADPGTLTPEHAATFLGQLTSAEDMIRRNGNTRLVMNVLALHMPQMSDSTRR